MLTPFTAVQIADPVPERPIEDDGLSIKQFRTSHGRRLSGKAQPPHFVSSSSRSSVHGGSPSLRPVDDSNHSSSGNQSRHQYYSEKLLAQVGDWLEHERKKASSLKKKTRRRKSASPPTEADQEEHQGTGRPRTDSIDSQSSEIGFDKLQRILEDSMASMGLGSLPHHPPKITRHRHRKRRSSLHRTASSDTDYVDGDAIVPACDVWLDNSKTLSYSTATANLEELDERAQREREAWIAFKNEIIRTAHTLKLKGWRRVPLDSGESIDVVRVSGALTNAVYVVTPPSDIPGHEGKKPPAKVLLRIYGPQVEHLIDRDNELKVLQRLARKKIGPRLLGTFQNGRFEEYFNASPLTPDDLRDPEVSKQIAKRMRELHDGIELLPHERDGGPAVWKNWESWLENTERIVTFLDKQVGAARNDGRRNSIFHAWKANGYVCGVPWPQFKAMVVKYREYLNTFYQDQKALNEALVFAHNDTQYGNILRFQPDDKKSPLLQPANKHKQLMVIDFEYAAANIPGQEFANHFSEWTYNYHDAKAPWACNATMYPKPDEQRHFLKAYVDHRPQFPHASSTPRLTPADGGAHFSPGLMPTNSSSSIKDFMLDSRAPPGGWTAADQERDEQTEKRVRDLLEETRLWRPVNSAMWVAWGVVQAKVPGLDSGEAPAAEDDDDDAGADEFDYLSYAQDRAFFFWGDLVQMGLVKAEELPEQLRARLKIVDY
ncbi:Choline kinase-like protein [Hapsidospora chrysogenum ATCC 11550]|uniref:Choline kinase-like protein n=1 Tax=Hapsidospora chrysogenum (strain ATCC 11550 / CBS 779.69 / DSM 880 / IAM 14645 / JCM 23072 / IMI 49137) TaxID=857340 RepID=A0A086TH06_HAPC1|nr:Choline kinase-like protein [Hapsidospora chrysogenum ATCC 11550]